MEKKKSKNQYSDRSRCSKCVKINKKENLQVECFFKLQVTGNNLDRAKPHGWIQKKLDGDFEFQTRERERESGVFVWTQISRENMWGRETAF